MKQRDDWKDLTSPGIVISLTGGGPLDLSSYPPIVECFLQALEFEISDRSTDFILQELMVSIEKLNPLIVTGGTRYGIMKSC